MRRDLLVAIALTACAPPPAHLPATDSGWIVEPLTAAPRATTAAPVTPVPLEQCGATEQGFDGWMVSFRAYALSKGIGTTTVERALAGTLYDPAVIELDRSQKPFKQSLAEFSARRVTRARIARGKRVLARERDLLHRVTARFGVQPEVLVAIWGLETDFGENLGSTSSLRALATLAYDCRRSARFRDELLSALRILERGDLTEAEMVGAWAGELGQLQFLPSSYERFGVDFDGDGRIDMVQSRADALASTANYLEGHGWRAREAYRVGSANFEALGAWNASAIYRETIVLFAARLVGR